MTPTEVLKQAQARAEAWLNVGSEIEPAKRGLTATAAAAKAERWLGALDPAVDSVPR